MHKKRRINQLQTSGNWEILLLVAELLYLLFVVKRYRATTCKGIYSYSPFLCSGVYITIHFRHFGISGELQQGDTVIALDTCGDP